MQTVRQQLSLLPKALRSLVPTHLRRVAVNSGWGFFGGLLTTALALIQAILAARLLGVLEYGFFTLIIASSGLLVQFADFRTWEVAIKFLPDKILRRDYPRAANLVYALILVDLFSGVIACLFTVALSGVLAQWVIHQSSLAELLIWFALSIPATMMANGTCVGILRAFDKFPVLAAKGTVMGIIKLVLIVSAVLLGTGLRGVIFVFIASEVLDAAFGLFLIFRNLRSNFNGGIPADFRLIRTSIMEMRHFLGQTWLSGSIKGLQNQLDIPLLGVLTTPTAVAYYRLAREISGTFSRIGNPVQDSTLPVFAELMSKGREKEIRATGRTLSVMLAALMLPVVLCVAVFSTDIVTSSAGAAYAPAAGPLVFLMIGISFNVVFSWARPAIVVHSRLNLSNAITIVSVLLGAFLYLLLVPRWQAVGASFATACLYLFSAVLLTWIAIYPTKQEHHPVPSCG